MAMNIINEKHLRLDEMTKAEQDYIHQEMHFNLQWLDEYKTWCDIENAKFERFDHVIYRTKP